jgi:UDP-N-acetyl-D-glucosamine dehydrogenase
MDCVVVLTDHTSIDYCWIAKCAPLLVDTRNVTKELPAELRKKSYQIGGGKRI